MNLRSLRRKVKIGVLPPEKRMKWLIASDLHGSAYYCARLMDRLNEENAERLLLLGDLLYHGPRNDLPKDYNPKAAIDTLNAKADIIYCVRGNCDSEVDQTVLDFPILADYCLLDLGVRAVYACHGHKLGKENTLKLRQGDLLLCGHTHIPECREKNGFIYMNPGSLSLPKENSWHGYMIFENGDFVWKNLDGEIKYKFSAERADLNSAGYSL